MNCFQNTNFSEDSQADQMMYGVAVVVNCFQNTNFSEDSQAGRLFLLVNCCCELLSEY